MKKASEYVRLSVIKGMKLTHAIFLNLLAGILLLCVTGYGYFTAYIPASWTDFLRIHNVTSIEDFLLWISAFEALRVLFSALNMYKNRAK